MYGKWIEVWNCQTTRGPYWKTTLYSAHLCSLWCFYMVLLAKFSDSYDERFRAWGDVSSGTCQVPGHVRVNLNYLIASSRRALKCKCHYSGNTFVYIRGKLPGVPCSRQLTTCHPWTAVDMDILAAALRAHQTSSGPSIKQQILWCILYEITRPIFEDRYLWIAVYVLVNARYTLYYSLYNIRKPRVQI
jgi:hypothetical protein